MFPSWKFVLRGFFKHSLCATGVFILDALCLRHHICPHTTANTAIFTILYHSDPWADAFNIIKLPICRFCLHWTDIVTSFTRLTSSIVIGVVFIMPLFTSFLRNTNVIKMLCYYYLILASVNITTDTIFPLMYWECLCRNHSSYTTTIIITEPLFPYL